jgi:hypothetical protein
MRFVRTCAAVVLGLFFASASSPALAADADAGSTCESEPRPGLYLRATAGPQATAYGYGLASWGGQLSVAAGWVVGRHTALAVELAASYGRVSGAWPADRWIEELGAHAVVLADHYLWGVRGWHVQAGTGIAAVASTGGTQDGENGNVPQTNDKSPAPVAVAGLGYDWRDAGLVARVETIPFLGPGPHIVPLSFLLGASLLHF